MTPLRISSLTSNPANLDKTCSFLDEAAGIRSSSYELPGLIGEIEKVAGATSMKSGPRITSAYTATYGTASSNLISRVFALPSQPSSIMVQIFAAVCTHYYQVARHRRGQRSPWLCNQLGCLLGSHLVIPLHAADMHELPFLANDVVSWAQGISVFASLHCTTDPSVDPRTQNHGPVVPWPLGIIRRHVVPSTWYNTWQHLCAV